MDIVILVKSNIVNLCDSKTLPSLFKYITFDNLYVITRRENFSKFTFSHSKLQFIDEDEVFEGLTFDAVRLNIEKIFGETSRPGWYLQQFIKLSMSYRDETSPDYLVWEADAIALRPIHFFDKEGKPYITKITNYYFSSQYDHSVHAHFFSLNKKLINMGQQVPHCFIAEHMMFNKDYVKEMLALVSKKSKEGDIWWQTILQYVEKKYLSIGFSEYEMYGAYIHYYHKGSFTPRKLTTYRGGTTLLGDDPTEAGLRVCSWVFHRISFEDWSGTFKYMVSTNNIFLECIRLPIIYIINENIRFFYFIVNKILSKYFSREERDRYKTIPSRRKHYFLLVKLFCKRFVYGLFRRRK